MYYVCDLPQENVPTYLYYYDRLEKHKILLHGILAKWNIR
jgi:hypothetical protein